MIQGKRIWDISRIPDREETRMELTDLIRFKGHWYCGFREGKIHHDHPSGRARIIRSSDGEQWESVALFEWDGGSVRTPRLSITAEGNLMAATSVYFVSKEPRLDGHVLRPDGEPLPAEVKARTDRHGWRLALQSARHDSWNDLPPVFPVGAEVGVQRQHSNSSVACTHSYGTAPLACRRHLAGMSPASIPAIRTVPPMGSHTRFDSVRGLVVRK